MNEQLFNEAAQARADQVRQRSTTVISAASVTPAEVSPITRHAIAFAAAVLVNLAVLGTLQWTAGNALYAPPGQVVITELNAFGQPQLAKN